MDEETTLKNEYRQLFLSLYPSEGERFSSKTQLIREMYDDIEKARQNKVSLVLLHRAIQEKSQLSITYNEFKQILYRIRKEQGASPKKAIPTPRIAATKNEPVVSPSSHENKPSEKPEDEFDLILEKYHQCDNQIDKYIALGGKREDIEDKSRSTQRNMVMTLRNKLRQKYRGI